MSPANQLALPIPESLIEQIADAVEQRVKSRLFGALTLAASPSRKLDVRQLSGGQRKATVREVAVHAPLDPTMRELAITAGITASQNGIKTVRSSDIAKELSAPGAPVTSKQVDAAWASDGRFDALGRGWNRVRIA